MGMGYLGGELVGKLPEKPSLTTLTSGKEPACVLERWERLFPPVLCAEEGDVRLASFPEAKLGQRRKTKGQKVGRST